MTTSTITPSRIFPKEDDALVALASELRITLARTARHLRRRGDAGLSPSLLSALASIEVHGPVTLGALAAHEGIQPPSMTRIAGKLGALGLIERETDAADRRVSRVRISTAGRKLLERTRSRRTAHLAKRLRTLTQDERDILRRASGLLQRLISEDRA